MRHDLEDPATTRATERERKIDPENLPDDPALLKEMIRELLSVTDKFGRRIDYLERQLFGRKSEKIDPTKLQYAFPLFPMPPEGKVEPAAPLPATTLASPASKSKSKTPAPGHGRRSLPANLPRERVVHKPADEECRCSNCRKPMKEIGREITEQLEFVAGHFVVKEHVQPKFACEAECDTGVVMAKKPPQPIEKGLPGPGLLAATITWKYCDHLPLYRQQGIFERSGIEIARSTLCDWTEAMADLLSPIYWLMKAVVLESRIVNSDDTVVPVLVEGRGETKQGRLWVYIGDAVHPVIVFDYTGDRKRDGPVLFLGGFLGRYLQADAYAGYDAIFASGSVVEVACWAHARRKYFDAQGSDRVRALTALAYVRKLYDVEEKGKPLGKEDRERLRATEARPTLEALKAWLDVEAPRLLPKSPMAQAMQYTLSLWTALNRYVEDGDLEIDNNVAERALRHVVTGRKNWMFAGSDEGGRRAAILFSIVATCKRHGVDPYAYLRDVIEKMPAWPKERVAELLPHRWKSATTAKASGATA
jgi:transposase